ncbi:hypothetical protein [Clostridium gasigenes]|uniref:hypothetical protein n=1 Tax=Clostridium gasigenes TaxID=94869 RepID=UPI001C0E18BC|nr:hypothetical protein [Clostridium gasigenes]MBU3109903.1 hypothetical protein [Clostridium gasigenes]
MGFTNMNTIQMINKIKKQEDDIVKTNIELEDIVIHDIKKLGAIGDNAQILKDLFASINDYENIYIPSGEFRIKITNTNITQIGNGGSLLITDGKKGIRITGKGRLILDTSTCTTKNWFCLLRNCEDIIIDGITVIGDAVFQKDVNVSDYAPNGIGFEKCRNVKFINNTIENVMACLS